MKKILTYGTFDAFHYGHFFLLERASQLGDHLTVAISSDEFNALKGKRAMLDFETRKHIVSSLKFVDEVIAEETWEQKIEDVLKYEIDLFVMGHDWEGKFDFLSDYCDVKYLERTPSVSSTLIRGLVSNSK